MEYLIIIPIALCCLYFLYVKASMGEVSKEQADGYKSTLEAIKQANDARADAGLRERVSEKYSRD